MYWKWLYSLIALNLFVFGFSDHLPDLQLNHLNISDGTTHVSCIGRDQQGYLWIGSSYYGVVRYDGYEMRQYENDPGDAGSLSHQLVNCLIVDSHSNVWIGTKNGLNRYLRDSDTFVRYFYNPNESSERSGAFVFQVFEDKSGTVWTVTLEGLYRYDPGQDQFLLALSSSSVSGIVRFTNIAEDENGVLWLVSSGASIIRFEKDSGEVVFFKNPLRIAEEEWNYQKLKYDSSGNLWILTKMHGLSRFDRIHETFISYSSEMSESGTGGTHIYDMAEIKGDRVVFAVNQGGLCYYNLASGAFSHQTSASDPDYSLSGDGVTSLYRDDEGILWIGTSRTGIDYYNPKQTWFNCIRYIPGLSNKIPGRVVSQIFEDHSGRVWIATDGSGMSVWEPCTDVVSSFSSEKERGPLVSGTIRNFTEDRNGKIWVATWDKGIFSIVKEKGQWIIGDQKTPAELLLHDIWSIFIDHQGRMWIAETNGSICCWDADFNLLFQRSDEELDVDHTPSFLELDGIGVVSVYSRKIELFDETVLNFKTMIEMNDGVIARFHASGEIFVGTLEQGVDIYNKQGDLIRRLTTRDGLNSNNISSIEIDRAGHVWISSNKGINRYDHISGKVSSFQYMNSMSTSGFFPESSAVLSSGIIAFGNSMGIVLLNPDKFQINEYDPTVFITGIRVFNSGADNKSKARMNLTHVECLDSLDLDWNSNFLEIRFTAPSMTFPEYNLFSFKMEGLEEDWNFTGSQARIAKYANLKPGEYNFKVRVCNNDAIWSPQERELKITIHPPFWRTNGFYAMVAVILVSAIVLIIRIRERGFVRNRFLLESKVAERTKLIEDQKNELEAQSEELRKHQMCLEELVEKRTEELSCALEKSLRSDKLKSHFLANISHEVRTPLNAIVGLSRFLNDEDLKKEDKADFTREIQRSSDSLLTFFDNIIDYSLIETGQLSLSYTSFELNGFVEEIACYYEVVFGDAEQHLLVDNRIAQESTLLNTDRRRLRQVLDHLIQNSSKFAVQGEIGLEFSQEADIFQICVWDSGPGIPDEVKISLFEPFIRSDDAQVQAVRGVGLGLSICKGLVQLLGGELLLVTGVQRGSRFCLKFPVDHIVDSSRESS